MIDDNQDVDELVADADVATTTVKEVKRPPMYKVLLFNDDFTPMEFVVSILQQIFAMPSERAVALMLKIHTQGLGVAGVYEHEIAETKANQVMKAAREHEHPLQCSIEKD